MQYHRHTQPTPEPVVQSSVSHFIIFNPTLQRPPPSSPRNDKDGERDRDLEDDLKEASQILFYTSREGGKVSRDKMLRQFGLVKGLMGFTDMVLEKKTSEQEGVKGWWGVHSQKSRMIIWTPEDGFYTYINITLPYKANGESVHGSQGISDQMIIDGLKRGYEDFKLLYGPLTSLDHASTTTSANLERFWTRFAFQFESTYLSPTDAGSLLPTWIGGYPTPPRDRSLDAEKAIGSILDHHAKEGSIRGLITRDGPLYTSSPVPESLTRYLINAIPLPPPSVTIVSPTPDRSSLGLGFGLGLRKKSKLPPSEVKGEERQSSWTSWVPGMPGTPKDKEVARDTSGSRWPSFGLSSMGMGTMFGGSAAPEQNQTSTVIAETQARAETASIASSHQVEQSEVVLLDLEAAVDTNEVEPLWEKKDIWLESEGGYGKRRLMWIIRDDKLLFIVFPPGTPTSYVAPSTSETLAVFAALPDQIRASVDSTRSATQTQSNSFIHRVDQRTDIAPGLDTSSSVTLLELRDQLISEANIHEIYAKSSTEKFLVATKSGKEEMYMQVGKTDASLTDAEQAVKIRQHLVA